MRFQKRIYRTMSKVLPNRYRMGVEELLKYSDTDTPVEEWTGKYVFIGFMISLLIYFILPIFFPVELYLLLVLILIIFIVTQLVPRFALDFVVSKRASFVEGILPDALLLISSNMRSGMTPDRAIMLSARPEFGPLEKQIREVAKIAMSGTGLDKALLTISENIKSKMLERTINLLIEGLRSGGEFATLLENIALDVKDLSILQKEVRASVTMYAIFILIAAVFGAPLLFGVSTYLITQISSITSQIDLPLAATASLPLSINLGPPPVSAEFLFYFAIAIVAMTSAFASIIMGLIMKGEEKEGVRYIPIFMVISIVVFLFTRMIMDSFIAAGNIF